MKPILKSYDDDRIIDVVYYGIFKTNLDEISAQASLVSMRDVSSR